MLQLVKLSDVKTVSKRLRVGIVFQVSHFPKQLPAPPPLHLVHSGFLCSLQCFGGAVLYQCRAHTAHPFVRIWGIGVPVPLQQFSGPEIFDLVYICDRNE